MMNVGTPTLHLPPTPPTQPSLHRTVTIQYGHSIHREEVRATCETVSVANHSSKGIKENLFIFFPPVKGDPSERWGFLFELVSKCLRRAYCV